MDDPYRLPRAVTPSRYDLTIRPDVEAGTFSGSVQIAVALNEPVGSIVLNAADLRLDEGRLEAAEGAAIEIVGIEQDAELQRATLELRETAPAGSGVLHLGFHGSFNERLHGLYRSTYRDEEGTTHTIATTQFEPADARRAFPCWDEPDLKATFGITLEIRDGLAAISNGPEVDRVALDDGWVRVRFADTMMMSTYLVAFVVGRLELTDPVEVGSVPVRIAHAPGRGHLTTFALEAAAFSMRFFREYYDIPYPDAKMDMVAMPDFAQGAMENTGCIIYRESSLLVDPSHATQPELENIADVVAHELAHQWFGNLVTMQWWNGIWLNEAFATFMALITVDAMRPEWERWAAFGRFVSVAKEVDALRNTRAIEYEVRSPLDTSGMFDVLTYQKGAAILRMMERFLGADRFRDGIRHYLKIHAFGNTETHDLWDAIEEATGEPVRRIMDQWIWQGGYPLLEVANRPSGLRVMQHRFLSDGGADDATWEVPLLVRQLGGDEISYLMDPAGIEVEAGTAGPLVVNAGATAFVRVRYDGGLRDELAGRLPELSPLERYGLVDDLWAVVVGGGATPSAFLDFAERFAAEDDLAVWQSILLGLGWCDRFVEGEPRERFRAFVRHLLAPALDRLQWEARDDDPDRVRALRGALLQGMGVLGADPNAQAAAREFEAESRAGAPVDPALAAASVNVIASTGTLEDYERFALMTDDAPTPQEQLRYLYSLPLFREPEALERTLASALDGGIRTQNAPFVLAFAMTERQLGGRAWSFVKEHWDALTDAFPPPLVIRMVDGLRYLATPEHARDAEAFFQAHPIPQSEKGLRQLLERQRLMVALRERATPDLAARFVG